MSINTYIQMHTDEHVRTFPWLHPSLCLSLFRCVHNSGTLLEQGRAHGRLWEGVLRLRIAQRDGPALIRVCRRFHALGNSSETAELMVEEVLELLDGPPFPLEQELPRGPCSCANAAGFDRRFCVDVSGMDQCRRSLVDFGPTPVIQKYRLPRQHPFDEHV